MRPYLGVFPFVLSALRVTNNHKISHYYHKVGIYYTIVLYNIVPPGGEIRAMHQSITSMIK